MSTINKFIGESIRHLRKAHNFTLEEMSARLSISYQQLQKYETATNRITADKLFEVANLLEVDLKNFFPSSDNFSFSRSQIKLAKNFAKIRDEKLKGVIIELCERLAG